jgi:hypothetical protein
MADYPHVPDKTDIGIGSGLSTANSRENQEQRNQEQFSHFLQVWLKINTEWKLSQFA